MKLLSLIIAAFSVLCLALATHTPDFAVPLLGGFGLLCAVTTWRSQNLSSFLKIFVTIFGVEVVAFGSIFLLSKLGLWPASFKEYLLPESVPLTVAIFSVLVWVVSFVPVVSKITGIADRFFKSHTMTTARIWPLPAFAITESRLAQIMVGTLVFINQVQVGMTVRLSYFNRDWFNAIQNKDEAQFWNLLLTVFLFWVVLYIASMIIEFIMQSMLIIRWRAWLTEHYVNRWLDGSSHYRMSLRSGNADNPDQRIAEDVNRFIDGGSVGYGIYSYSILLISTLSSLVSFALILWDLSSDFTIPGTTIAVPGFLFWMALIYAAIGTIITHGIGRSLVRLSFERQRFEADFRFSLARLREYSEQVALLGGETAERKSSMGRFGNIFANYLQIVDLRKKLMAFTASYGQISPFIPYIVAAPFYFAGKIQLGVLSQTAGAFARVEGALDFFITYYTSLADFKAVLDRLTTFDDAIEAASHSKTQVTPTIALGSDVSLMDVSLSLPDGRTIVSNTNLVFEAGNAVLVTGPSGSGKSTLFRAIAGIWPFGMGQVHVPVGAHVMLLPQKPYLPMGRLRSAITYPSDAAMFDDATIRDALEQARLPDFVDRLDEDDNWAQRLSGGEQQRLALARAVLAQPDWLFLDEATSALDETSEALLYKMIAEKMPKTTIVSIGHRKTLEAFHSRRVELRANAHGSFTAVDISHGVPAE